MKRSESLQCCSDPVLGDYYPNSRRNPHPNACLSPAQQATILRGDLMCVKDVFLVIVILFVCSIVLSCSDNDGSNRVRFIGWAVGSSYVLHTQDGGTNWTRQGDSQQFADADFQDICILDKENALLIGAQSNVACAYRTENGGTTWTLARTDPENCSYYNGGFVLDKDNIWIVGDQGTIYYVTDMGTSWTKMDVPEEYQETHFNRVCAKSKEDIWIATDNYISDNYPILLHTTNGGVTLEKLNPLKDLKIIASQQGHYLGIQIVENSIWAVGGFGQYVIRSGDYGVTWADITAAPSDSDANGIFPFNETDAYLVTDYGGMYSTIDAGKTWTQHDVQTINFLTGIASLKTTNIWVSGTPGGGGGGDHAVIKYSSDGGQSWHDQTPQVLKDNPGVPMYKIRFISSQ
jgi:photosystem II stability/assembly factor-like uncharacterized protein